MKLDMSPKEIITLRLKCLEPFIQVASRHSIEQDVVMKKAEEAWKYAIKPLLPASENESPGDGQAQSDGAET